MDQADGRRTQNISLSIIYACLHSGIKVRDSVAWVQSDKVREMTMSVRRRVHIELPFCSQNDYDRK